MRLCLIVVLGKGFLNDLRRYLIHVTSLSVTVCILLVIPSATVRKIFIKIDRNWLIIYHYFPISIYKVRISLFIGFLPDTVLTTIHFNFMVAPCINNIKHIIDQQMHTNYKIHRLLKIVKIIKSAATCFGSHKTIIREPHPVLS